MLCPFSTVFDLIEFFHRDSRGYGTKDSILSCLVGEYQKGNQFHRLSAFFLVLFTPGIVRVYSIARRKTLALGPDEVLSQICLYLLETINGIHLKQSQTKVASRIIGRVKNRMRGWVNLRLKEAVEAYKGTLEVFEATRAAHYLGITKANLQFAEHLLHKRRD